LGILLFFAFTMACRVVALRERVLSSSLGKVKGKDLGMKQIFSLLIGVFVALPQFAMAQDGYQIKPGDVLRIEVLEDSNLDRDALVLPDGSISVPQAGSIDAAGRSVADVQAELAARLGPNFAAPPNVYVGVATLAPSVSNGTALARTISVYVMGEANNPGRYEVKPGSTLLQVLAESGGLSNFAATKRLQIRRGASTYTFNYQAVERGESNVNPVVLTEGDVIIVPQRRLFE
jgi:polysaccharide export outer membrane protein